MTDTIELAKKCGASTFTEALETIPFRITFGPEELESFRAECVKEAHQWQKIETAPKDGTTILVSTKNGLRYVVSYDDVFAASWRIINEFGFSETTPTNWMQLPPAPNATGKE